MTPLPSRLALHALRSLTRSSAPRAPSAARPASFRSLNIALHNLSIQPRSSPSTARRTFTSSTRANATLNQVRNRPRQPKKARRAISPAMIGRPEMKGVCLKVGITKPKKPNSGQRKTAKVRLSSGRVVSCYIPGEGHNVQQHSVVMVRGGRSQDCPGVRYHLVRGSLDLGGVPNRATSRSKYGTKKPKTV